MVLEVIYPNTSLVTPGGSGTYIDLSLVNKPFNKLMLLINANKL